MADVSDRQADDVIAGVRLVAEACLESALAGLAEHAEGLKPGKMLRTRLAARMFESGAVKIASDTLHAVCAATELAHTASLCHDDVVDNALIRRSMPTLWQSAGPSGAILIGDLLLCEAINLIMAADDGRFLPAYVAKVQEVVLFDNVTQETRTLPIDGVFIAIGYLPAVGLAEKLGLELTADGFIKRDAHHRTTVPGIYSAGDVEGGYKQIVTAVGQGAEAALSIYEDLMNPYWLRKPQ